MKFFLLLGDVLPPTPKLVRTFELPQPETIWIAGVALAVAVFLTVLGLLRRQKRLQAVLAAAVAATVVLGLTALAAQHSTNEWRAWDQQRGFRTLPPPPDWGRFVPPPESGPAVAPPP